MGKRRWRDWAASVGGDWIADSYPPEEEGWRTVYFVAQADAAEEERDAAIANGWKYVVGVYHGRP